jgi:malonyl-CoA O-methyltransferase
MVINEKKKIQQRFDAASVTYETVATVQKNCADILITTLQAQWPLLQPSSMLDLGTGTGYGAERLSSCFPDARLTLNDLSPNMLATAQEKLHAHCEANDKVGDFEALNLGHYDLIFSNLAFQWADDLKKTLQKYYQTSQFFAFSCLLDGTFQAWDKLLQKHLCELPLNTHPSREYLERFLLSLNPEHAFFTTHAFQLTFQSPKAFMLYLKQLGASSGNRTLSMSQMKQLIQLPSEPLHMTYHVFFGFLKRPS